MPAFKYCFSGQRSDDDYDTLNYAHARRRDPGSRLQGLMYLGDLGDILVALASESVLKDSLKITRAVNQRKRRTEQLGRYRRRA